MPLNGNWALQTEQDKSIPSSESQIFTLVFLNIQLFKLPILYWRQNLFYLFNFGTCHFDLRKKNNAKESF